MAYKFAYDWTKGNVQTRELTFCKNNMEFTLNINQNTDSDNWRSYLNMKMVIAYISHKKIRLFMFVGMY